MSDESHCLTDLCGRSLFASERRLVQVLIEKAADVKLPAGWLDNVKVSTMNDGGMGSLRFLSSSANKMGKQAAEVCFLDLDGVEVIASLNLDDMGLPFELNMWKVDFSPLVQIPERLS